MPLLQLLLLVAAAPSLTDTGVFPAANISQPPQIVPLQGGGCGVAYTAGSRVRYAVIDSRGGLVASGAMGEGRNPSTGKEAMEELSVAWEGEGGLVLVRRGRGEVEEVGVGTDPVLSCRGDVAWVGPGGNSISGSEGVTIPAPAARRPRLVCLPNATAAVWTDAGGVRGVMSFAPTSPPFLLAPGIATNLDAAPLASGSFVAVWVDTVRGVVRAAVVPGTDAFDVADVSPATATGVSGTPTGFFVAWLHNGSVVGQHFTSDASALSEQIVVARGVRGFTLAGGLIAWVGTAPTIAIQAVPLPPPTPPQDSSSAWSSLVLRVLLPICGALALLTVVAIAFQHSTRSGLSTPGASYDAIIVAAEQTLMSRLRAPLAPFLPGEDTGRATVVAVGPIDLESLLDVRLSISGMHAHEAGLRAETLLLACQDPLQGVLVACEVQEGLSGRYCGVTTGEVSVDRDGVYDGAAVLEAARLLVESPPGCIRVRWEETMGVDLGPHSLLLESTPFCTIVPSGTRDPSQTCGHSFARRVQKVLVKSSPSPGGVAATLLPDVLGCIEMRFPEESLQSDKACDREIVLTLLSRLIDCIETTGGSVLSVGASAITATWPPDHPSVAVALSDALCSSTDVTSGMVTAGVVAGGFHFDEHTRKPTGEHSWLARQQCAAAASLHAVCLYSTMTPPPPALRPYLRPVELWRSTSDGLERYSYEVRTPLPDNPLKPQPWGWSDAYWKAFANGDAATIRQECQPSDEVLKEVVDSFETRKRGLWRY